MKVGDLVQYIRDNPASYAEFQTGLKTNDLGKHKIPDGSFSFVMIKDSEKINRTTYEIYDESINNSSKERTSDK